MDIYKRIYELENEIAALPQGSINMKKIYGKEQPYLQWTENGKSKSKYIKKNEREEIFAGVERRKQLQEELKELKQHSSIDPSKSTDFETSVIIGERLLALTKGVKNWGKRDCFRQLQAYLNSEETDRVCLVFGLRRTGKTTMLRQAVLGMTPSQSAKSASVSETFAMELMNSFASGESLPHETRRSNVCVPLKRVKCSMSYSRFSSCASFMMVSGEPVSYTHLRAHET